MSLFGRALAGVGEGAANIANKYIDEQLAQQRAQAIADIQQKSQLATLQATDTYTNDPTRRANLRTQAVQDEQALGTAKGATDLQNTINAASNQQLNDALAAREAAAARAKDENTTKDVAPGVQQFRNGQMVGENTRPTNAEVTRDAYAAGTKGNLGKTTRADRFDDKEWDAARKVDPSVVTFTDAMSGKAVEDPLLRQTYRLRLTELQAQGDYSPQEASDMARTSTLKLKNAAQDRVDAAKAADPKSTLTESKAVQQIMTEFAARQKPAASPAAPSPAAPPAPSLADKAAAVAPVVVPGPPPQYGYNGNARALNPAYTAWEKQYGAAYTAQQAQQDAADAASRASAQSRIDAARGANAMPRVY